MPGEMESRAVDVRGAGGELHLVRDLLDKQLVDRRHDPMGRADGIVLVVPAEGPPQVACIETGVTVLAGRLGRRLGRWARAGSRRWGLRGGKPFRVPWPAVVKVGIETEVDLDANATPVLAWEHWLLEHVVRYVPSLKPENKEKRERAGQRNAEPAPGPERQPHVRGRRVRLHRLLNHEVVDSEGRRAGRVEEVRARAADGECVVEEYLLGREGLMERLSIVDLSLVALRALGARHGAAGRRVPWRQMDLSDPRRPRLRCTLAELDGGQRLG